MTDYTVRSLTIEELPECLDTIRKAFSVNCERFGFTKENYPSCAAFLTLEELVRAKENGTHFYAVFIDGKMAGTVQLKRLDDNNYSFTRFAVLPKYQSLGLGRVLINYCKGKSKEYGAEKMRLLMMYDNEPLRHFYESCGFTLVEKGSDAEHPFVYAIYETDV